MGMTRATQQLVILASSYRTRYPRIKGVIVAAPADLPSVLDVIAGEVVHLLECN